ncbi:MAG: radical SAM protein [Planctomycetota bacterium]|nr:radical SAM protein [Planctomycetota bacterium]
MKWTRRGREFAGPGLAAAKVRRIHIFGAGLNGGMLHDFLRSRLEIAGFLDNEPRKREEGFLGLPVRPPEEIEAPEEGEAIIVALAPAAVSGALRQLKGLGFAENGRVFPMQTFCPLYFLYARNEVCFPSLSFLPTTSCNLRCRHCLNFSPLLPAHGKRSLKALTESLDLLFAKVDYVMLFHISGGEPLLYPELADLLGHIGDRYGKRVCRLELTTNGTVVPTDDVCDSCRRHGVHVMLDDYRESLPGRAGLFESALGKFLASGVTVRLGKPAAWVDLTPPGTDHSDWGAERLGRHFEDCRVPWQEYRDGILHACNYAAYAALAGLQAEDEGDWLDLRRVPGPARAELVEFRLGCNAKGYVEFCRKCAGYGNNANLVKAAGQLASAAPGAP